MWLGEKKKKVTKLKGHIFFLIFQVYDLVGSYTHNIKVRFAPLYWAVTASNDNSSKIRGDPEHISKIPHHWRSSKSMTKN